MLRIRMHRQIRAAAAAALVACFAVSATFAQDFDRDRWDRYRNGRWDATTRPRYIEAGTLIPVRVTQLIAARRADDRLFRGVIVDDIWDDYGRLSMPLIPRGTPVTLRVRSTRGDDLILDLDSIIVAGNRYIVDSSAVRLEGRRNGMDGGDAAAVVGSGAVIGTIIGAIAGGGKGAAVGAATGAAVGGAAVMAQGREVRVPSGAVITFRLDRPLLVGGRYR